MADASAINRFQLLSLDAVKIVSSTKRHHALCFKSISMMQDYSVLFETFWSEHLNSIPADRRRSVASWWIQVQDNNETAIRERASGFPEACTRTTIVLADVVENIAEGFLSEATLASLSGGRCDWLCPKLNRKVGNLRAAKNLVRDWERTIKDQSRVTRFSMMLSTYFPDFDLPQNARILDRMFTLRNQMTHDIVERHRAVDDASKSEVPSLEEIDRFFEAADEFVLSIMRAVASYSPPACGRG